MQHGEGISMPRDAAPTCSGEDLEYWYNEYPLASNCWQQFYLR